MFGTDWIYNFNNLENNELLEKKDDIWDEYKPKDQIFEIYKLVDMSENNPKFSELFYEIRHKTYAKAWEEYKLQLTGDIIEQVFMSVTASLLSAAVEAAITAVTVGTGWSAAKAAATLTYVAVYTLMTKFSIDRKLHEAESKERSKTFYPASDVKVEPEYLNEKCIYDRVLQDTMAAALLGHPGGFYQTVSGDEPGNSYTGHLVVSPPNLARVLSSFGGFLDLLWENFWNAGESDPDSYTALDFDDLNLDYLLTTSELPFYNTKTYYTYHNTEFVFDTYNMYSYNTLGALETQVLEGSSGQFDAIRPTCIDGAPQYEFINSTLYNTVLPQQILYGPVVLSQTRYDQIKPALGRLTVKVRCKDYDKTLGINPYAMNEIEQEVYEAKVPLNDNGFEYPIRYVYIDVVNYDVFEGTNYFAQDLLVNESDYAIDCGNLYFTKSLEGIISEKYSGFEEFLSETWASDLIKSTIYYNVRVVFDRFVPDTTDETNNLALAQATSYAIMDYFNQYTYAEISANMISEVTYTETLTFWSTLISAPLVYFGSWAVSAGVGKMFGEAGSKAVQATLQKSIMGGLVGTVVSPIKEVFQEIIEDGFKEALIENLVSIAGGTDDLGFWLSSLSTSVREVKGALGQLTFGETNLKNTFTLIHAISSGDIDTRLEFEQRIAQDLKQRQEAEKAKQAQMSFWDNMLKTDLLKGLFMVIPSIFFGSFSFIALSGFNKMVTSSIKLSPAAYAEHASWKHSRRKKDTIKAVGTQRAFSSGRIFTDRVLGATKKPAELESVASDINNEFKDEQETGILPPPQTAQIPTTNPNPKTETRKILADKFNTIAFENYFNEWIEGYIFSDERFKAFKSEFKQVQQNYREIGFQKAEKDAIDIIKNALKEDKFNLRFLNMFGVEFYDPDFILIGASGPSTRTEGSQLLKQNAFEAKMTTLDKVNEIKGYFGVSGDYAMYVKVRDDQLISIPVDSETNLANWLTDNHHSIDSKIYVAPSSLTIEEFHTLDNWQDHPSYVLQDNIKSLFSIEFDKEFYQLLEISEGIFGYHNNKLKKSLNSLFTDRTLYQWLFKVENHPAITGENKRTFQTLIMNYRADNGLQYQDPAIDTLVGALRMAVQHEDGFDTPSDRKLSDFFNFDPTIKIFRKGARSILFQQDHVLKLVYGLYRRSSARFILNNFGKTTVLDEGRTSLAVRKALLAINQYCESKDSINFGEAPPLQRLITACSWHLSDIHNGGNYYIRSELAGLFGLEIHIIDKYLTGVSRNVKNMDFIERIRDLVSDLKEDLNRDQSAVLGELYRRFYAYNSRSFSGVHRALGDLTLSDIYDSSREDYTSRWFNPDVAAKHYVELLLKQGGLLPAGRRGEGADNYDVSLFKARHHIDFYKPSIDPLNLILLGNLHYNFINHEAKGDLDYYTRMRYMRDSFENAIPPSCWESNLQDLYIERLKEFIIGWENDRVIQYTKQGPPTYEFVDGEWVIVDIKIDFIKMNYKGKTYDLQGMLEKGWITEDWVSSIIQDLRQKLESRGLM